MTNKTAGLSSTSDAPQSREEQINRLLVRARALLHNNARQSEVLAKQAFEIASRENPPYPFGIAESWEILSIIEWDRSEYQTALSHALQALEQFETLGNICKQAEVLNHIAGINYFLGNTSQALEYGFTALQLAEQCNQPGLLASILNDTGYAMLHLGNPRTALTQLMRSLAMHREVGSLSGEAQALDSIGKAYLLLGDTEQALNYAQQSLELDRKIEYHRAETEALGNIGKIWIAAGDVDRAISYFQQSLVLSQARGYRQFEAATLFDLSQAQLVSGKVDQAVTTLKQAQAVADDIGTNPVLAEIHRALADIYEQAGDITASLNHYKQFHTLQEAASNEMSTLRLNGLRATHEAETARQQAEIYRLKNVELQKEIEEREKLIAELDAFSRTVAHDLKNPLWVITGLGEYILEFLLTTGDKTIIQMGNEQIGMGYKMGRIIDELLLLAQVRQHTVTPEIIDMRIVINEVRARLARQISEQQAELLMPDTWPAAQGYAPWIEEIWANYISNAIKYGGHPPRVELGAQRENGHVRFWVRDNGSGLLDEERAQLFTEFTRLPSKHGSKGGHGLGLSIVKRIVEKLGGTVGIDSQPGSGSTFSFTLPAAADETPNDTLSALPGQPL
jgi:signal transduction histidine kinase